VSIGRFTGVFADVNGDGLGDRVGLRTNSGDLYVHVTYGRGDGRFLTGSPVLAGTTAPTWWSSTGQMMVGDVDGDGRFTPVASFSDNDEWHLITSLPSTRFGAKLASATYPTGGRVELTYVPSTAYPNGYLPFAFRVLASSRVLDGRGAVATHRLQLHRRAVLPRRASVLRLRHRPDGSARRRDPRSRLHPARRRSRRRARQRA
jgi:hypothetical protein